MSNVDVITSIDGTIAIRIERIPQQNEEYLEQQKLIENLLQIKGSAVYHTFFGNGTIIEPSPNIVKILFEDGTTRKFWIKTCLEKNLFKPYQAVPVKDARWFANIKWSETCLDCQKKHNGSCHSISCAEDSYDPWGDELPGTLWFMDGNNVAEYLEKKRKQKEAERKRQNNFILDDSYI